MNDILSWKDYTPKEGTWGEKLIRGILEELNLSFALNPGVLRPLTLPKSTIFHEVDGCLPDVIIEKILPFFVDDREWHSSPTACRKDADVNKLLNDMGYLVIGRLDLDGHKIFGINRFINLKLTEIVVNDRDHLKPLILDLLQEARKHQTISKAQSMELVPPDEITYGEEGF